MRLRTAARATLWPCSLACAVDARRSRASSRSSWEIVETRAPQTVSSIAIIAGGTSWPPPGSTVPLDQRLCLRRSPRSRGVRRQLRRSLVPCGQDRIDECPLLLDLVTARKERGITAEGIEDERLVRVRRVEHERGAVNEVHVHGADAQSLHRHLRAE